MTRGSEGLYVEGSPLSLPQVNRLTVLTLFLPGSWLLVPVLCDLFLVPGLWFLASGSWSLVPGLWFLASGSWSLVPGLWSLVPGLWSLVPGL